ncbi:hypothetical protein EVAR_30809_1 [Eumeta japonica]|uniref:Uncharacterized protein n=1 Tax=Eumeta variegata TaxID=151549 RepID=A0A4C1V953_EUMVA|nr:hypothetical protein EVAR_30809_1 [Eumeta japonica]
MLKSPQKSLDTDKSAAGEGQRSNDVCLITFEHSRPPVAVSGRKTLRVDIVAICDQRTGPHRLQYHTTSTM